MKRGILLDTDVAIDYLRGEAKAARLIETNLDRIRVSVITVAEIRAGTKGQDEAVQLERFLSVFPTLDVTRSIADLGGDWMRKYATSQAMELPDALIAATAARHDLELKTLNVRHYPMFKGAAPAYRK